ncbi:MAG TPA: TonB-dependent receptor [Ohtaekwangia sp.]|uniref:TonB-dependent receptor plug domain-containing protein n=1 Tax=Ohtaekwangia sp. TaxID=2066019 RepID=UPI002F92E51E
MRKLYSITLSSIYSHRGFTYRQLVLLLGIITASCNTLHAQESDSSVYNMSLEEIMNIKIISASKKAENLFEAPLSASVLTKEEIVHAGATTIMEALRLVPGVIVREQSNGNYDIHIRGLDNIPPNTMILSSTNTTTLVMINNRPVYNYLQGGTFWESLPIDLNDVEKIEVIRGPSSTLYGPNAVSGVINIITANVTDDGLHIHANAQYGIKNTGITNATAGYRFNNKMNVQFSGNYQTRGRDPYYINYSTNQWVNSADALPFTNTQERYPHPDKSMIKHGLNSYLQYTPNDNVDLNLTAGLQNSEVQNIMFDNLYTNMNTTITNSKYIDLRARTYKLNTQLSYAHAAQNPVAGMEGSKCRYNVIDATSEYEFTVQSLSIKPGVTYRSAVYDDRMYWSNGNGALNGRRQMETFGGSVRLEYKMLQEKLRLTGGARTDRFTHPDRWFLSYQAAASYQLTEKHLLRAVYSKAYRSPFIFDTYLNYTLTAPIGQNLYSTVNTSGNKNLDLLNSTMFEVGYRAMLKSNISLDVEAYSTRTENYASLIQGQTQSTPQNYPIVASTSLHIMNLPLSVQQTGATVSLNAIFDKVQLKPFVTLQKTTLHDYSPYFNTADASPSSSNNNDPATNNINSGKGTSIDHKFTPKAYGGAYANYHISSKFNMNANIYWFTKQTFYQRDNLVYQDGVRGVEHVKSKLLLQAKLSYTPVKSVTVFVNGRNLLAKKSREYYSGDVTFMMLLGGINFSL